MTSNDVFIKWYITNCNGDWEHENRIRIESMDNPGWLVRIDLAGTILETATYNYNVDNGEQNWVKIEIKENVFIAMGDLLKLDEISSLFYELFKKEIINSLNNIYTIYIKFKSLNGPFWRPAQASIVDLQQFKVLSVNYDYQLIKVKKIQDFENLSEEVILNSTSNYNVGDTFFCNIEQLYDGINLVVSD